LLASAVIAALPSAREGVYAVHLRRGVRPAGLGTAPAGPAPGPPSRPRECTQQKVSCRWPRQMRWQAAPAIRVRQVRPPYAAIQELDRGGDGLARGSVLVLDAPSPVQAIESEIEVVVSDLRRRHSVSLALRLPDPDGSQPLWLVVWAYRLGIRAFLPPDGRIGEPLRHWLANPLDLAGDWLDWVRLRHPVSRES